MSEDDPRAIGMALAAADRAIALSQHAPEPHFNRAAIVSALGIHDAAVAAWKKYCDAEPDAHSPWLLEAKDNIVQLAGPTKKALWSTVQQELEVAAIEGATTEVDKILRKFPREARAKGESLDLTAWADAWLARRTDAARPLTIARVVGERLVSINGERLLHDAVVAINRSIANGTADTAARAHLTYRDARLLIRDRKPSEAGPKLKLAQQQFAAIGTPMALVALYYRATTLFDERDSNEAAALLSVVENDADTNYLSLRAQVLWERARMAARLGKPFVALRDATTSTELFNRLGESEFATRTRIQAASSLARLGRPEEAWRLYRENFRQASESGSPLLLEAAIHAAFQDEIFGGRYDVARAIGDLLLSLPSENPIVRFDVLLWRTFLDQTPNASQRIAQARSAANALPDKALREDAQEQVQLAEGIHLRKSAPKLAIALLDASIDFNMQAGRISRLRDAYVERARAHIDLHDDQSAERDLLRAIDLREQQSELADRIDLRDTFFGSAQAACNALVDIYARRGAYEIAFAAAERCRGRSLGGIRATLLDLDDLQRALPAKTTLIHYTVSEAHTLALVLNGRRFWAKRLPMGRAEILRNAEALLSAIRDNDTDAISSVSQGLSAKLLPFLPAFASLGERFVIVPDGPIAMLPFALLKNPQSQVQLVASHSIVIAQSASNYVTYSTRQPLGQARFALTIGDPAASASFMRLPRLPQAAAESRTIAQMYPNSLALVGHEATTAAVMRQFPAADVVHIAAHSFVNKTDALWSGIVLTPDADDGVLYLHNLLGLALPRAPLIVLAGCGTAVKGDGQGEIRSLALGFLAVGSRGVVGSLWDIDDMAARTFSLNFHRRVANGRLPSDALRETQLEMMRDVDPKLRAPAAWAGFQLIGAE